MMYPTSNKSIKKRSDFESDRFFILFIYKR